MYTFWEYLINRKDTTQNGSELIHQIMKPLKFFRNSKVNWFTDTSEYLDIFRIIFGFSEGKLFRQQF